MIRAVCNSAFIFVWTALCATLGLVVVPFDPTGNGALGVAVFWARAIVFVTGCRVSVDFRQPLPRDGIYVFMSNHVSSADIWVLLAVLPVRVRFIAKKQLGRIPFLGWGIRAARFIFIDRQNPAAARRSINAAAVRIRGGDSVLMFPEGTRSADGKLATLKQGGFHLAMSAGVPIVPVAVAGTRACSPKGSFWVRPGAVHVTVGEPIATAGLADGDRPTLIERVHGTIANMLASTR